MPQLMPMFWKNSVFMGFILLTVLIIFYFFKKNEKVLEEKEMELKVIMFEFLW